MNVTPCDNWTDFRQSMARYCQLSQARRNEFWFRGQGDSKLPLQATLDRVFPQDKDDSRQRLVKELLTEFRDEAVRLQYDDRFTGDIDKLELLARHHGLPSPLLDWTLSPFAAAYFAFADNRRESNYVSVWMLDIGQLEDQPMNFDLISDMDKIEGNPRALRQKGVFLRVTSIRKSIEDFLGSSLYRFDIPADEKSNALAELDEMMVNGTYLYYDLNGAAETATHRIGATHGRH